MEPSASQEDDQDRISQLPDEILHHILSYFFNTKDVVRTCILSKRWRDVWASMPYLRFLDDDREPYDANEEMTIDFPTFVNKALTLRKPLGVHSFCIRWLNDFNGHGPGHIMTWVQYAINHNVKKLNISLTDGIADSYEFPSCVFTCPTLEFLDLSTYGPYANLPSVVHLGRLRELYIDHFTSDSVLVKALISGCPVLEGLHIFGSRLQDLDISSISLKKLDIQDCVFSGTRIRLSIPSLLSLEISGNNIQRLEILLENLSSLVKAILQTENYDGHDLVNFDQESLKFVCPRSEGASRVELSEFHAFPKLRKLELHGRSMLENFPTVVHFLQHSPNLKLLTMYSIYSIYSLYDGQRFTLKRSFVCCHREIYITCECGVENGRISELMAKFFNSQCGCYQE